ncbi:PBECR4 domain-containing protein [uncultured Limosilactobacillus sp.]|uniref:PBECR4 domain-containing protein n=1 Tax=uncultured Limosilactobacillus sp. TaxID=2837629 RepID=UPI0025FA459B|nr:PBECR4 domain-containing protein [uncultured Limosilactobacillus sp.]
MNQNKKKNDNNTPYSLSDQQGNGLPEQQMLNHEFTRPSTKYFSMKLDKNPRHRDGYHVASSSELASINKNIDSLIKAAKFYESILTKGYLLYVYKSSSQEIKTLKVKYATENFAHLTGLIFDRKSANEMLKDICSERLQQNAILVKNDGTTMDKLKIVFKLNEIENAKSTELEDFNSVKQAKRLHFQKGIKSYNKELLLALRYFNPKIATPFSLINLKKSKLNYSDYSQVPNNKILAVLSETKNEVSGLSIGTLSINQKYVKSAKQVVEITQAMNQQLIKDYMLEKQEQPNHLTFNLNHKHSHHR